MSGFYYIGIEGETASNYNINIKLYRRSSLDKNDTSIQSIDKRLHYGVLDQGLLYYQQTEHYYFYTDKNKRE